MLDSISRSARLALLTSVVLSVSSASAITWLNNSQQAHDYGSGVDAKRIAHVPLFRARYMFLGSMFNIPGIPGPNLRPILQNMNGDLTPLGGATYIRPGENTQPYPTQLFLNPDDFYSTSDFGWIVCGRYEEGDEIGGGQLQFGGFLLKLDAALQVQWFMQYPNVNNLYSVVETLDASGALMYIAVGDITAAGSFLTDALAAGFDSNGNVLWARTLWGIKDGLRGHAVLNDVIVYDANSVAAAGSGNIRASSSGVGLVEADVLVTRIDTNGIITFAEHYGQTITNAGGNQFGVAETGASLVRVTNSPDLAITGRADTICITACGPISFDDKLTFRINPAGNVLWSNRYDLQGFAEGGVEIRALGPVLHIAADAQTTYRTGTTFISDDVAYFALHDATGLPAKGTEVFGSAGYEIARSLLALSSPPATFRAAILGRTQGFSFSYGMPYLIERLPSIRRRCADNVVPTNIPLHDLPRWPVFEGDIFLPQRTQPLLAVPIRPNQRIICYKIRIGDLNFDGTVSVADIGAFVLALTRPDQYPEVFPGGDIEAADINGDGLITVSDIGGFVELLTNPEEE